MATTEGVIHLLDFTLDLSAMHHVIIFDCRFFKLHSGCADIRINRLIGTVIMFPNFLDRINKLGFEEVEEFLACKGLRYFIDLFDSFIRFVLVPHENE